ncbi:MAG: radical SAM protein, partial [Deltaproteobacteria bacterium]|nr:radical SAM protein [Deltaproteobacteria bacterium]
CRQEHIDRLRSQRAFLNFDAYKRSVIDLGRLLARPAKALGLRLTFRDFEDPALSPLRSSDLIEAAERPEKNPFYPYFQGRFPALLKAAAPERVGFSLNYLSQALCTFAMIGHLRKIDSRLPIVLGGSLVTSWMRRPDWRDPFSGLVDHLVAGPGEAPLLALCGRSGSEETYRPVYGRFPLDQYLSPGLILPYSGSRGCWWHRCAFCPERAEQNPYRPARPATVLAELRELTSLKVPALLHFTDNALSPPLLEALAEDPPFAPWYGFARITSHLLDADFCASLKRAGCAMLKLGVESGDQRVLDDLNKGIRLDDAAAALKNLRAAGIASYVYLLFGTPRESYAEARRTLDFTVEQAGRIDFLNLAIFNLPAFSPEAASLETDDFYPGDLSLYRNFRHPQGWSRKEVRSFIEKEFKAHPAIASILRREPPFFGSNHAPFFSGRGNAPDAWGF